MRANTVNFFSALIVLNLAPLLLASGQATDQLPAVGAAVPETAAPDPAREVILKFIRAGRMHDLDAVTRLTIEREGLELLVQADPDSPPPTEQEVDEGMGRITVSKIEHDIYQDPSRAKYNVDFGGVYMPLHVIKVGDEWKVDPRFWIAYKKRPDEPVIAARKFFYALIAKSAVDLEPVCLPHDDLWVLSHGRSPPGGDMDVYAELCMTMPMVRLGVDEPYPDSDGEIRKVKEADVGDDRLILLGLFGPADEVVFKMSRVDGVWRVDASDMIARAMDSIPEDQRVDGALAYQARLLDGRVMRTLRGDGDVDALVELLARDLPQNTLNHALFGAVREYWYRNQGGELPKNSNWYQMADLLIEHGADVNMQVAGGRTALSELLTSGNGHNQEMIRLLLANGADLKLKNEYGQTAVDIVSRWPDHHYRELIIEHAGKQAAPARD